MARFEGVVSLVSHGVSNGMSNSLRVPALQIGDKTLRGTVMHDELFSLLVPGERYRLDFGRMLFWRWLLRMECNGQVHRCPIVSFLLFNIGHAWFSGFLIGGLSALAFSSRDAQAGVGVASGLILFLANVKAWIK